MNKKEHDHKHIVKHDHSKSEEDQQKISNNKKVTEGTITHNDGI